MTGVDGQQVSKARSG